MLQLPHPGRMMLVHLCARRTSLVLLQTDLCSGRSCVDPSGDAADRSQRGNTKTKCQCYCKVLWQIPCLDLREESGREGIGWRSTVHSQLLPPLLMQGGGALHCNLLSLRAVYAEETDSAIQHDHHAKSHRHKLKYETFDKMYKSMHAALYKTGLFIEFIHCTARERNRTDEICFYSAAAPTTEVNFCNLRGLSCTSWSR